MMRGETILIFDHGVKRQGQDDERKNSIDFGSRVKGKIHKNKKNYLMS